MCLLLYASFLWFFSLISILSSFNIMYFLNYTRLKFNVRYNTKKDFVLCHVCVSCICRVSYI